MNGANMKVIVFKLDTPGNKYEWFVKDIEIKTLDDIEKIAGFCAQHIYAEIYHIDEDDDFALFLNVRKCLSVYCLETAKDTIMRLFTIITKTYNEQRS